MHAPSQIRVFDRHLVLRHRARAAPRFLSHNALYAEMAAHLIDRLKDVKRDFETVLDIGGLDGALAHYFEFEKNITANAMDFSADEILSVAPESFDLIVSNLSLHWINDLPGALIQIRKALKPGGLFLAALPGERTLHELRACLLDAELAVTGGVSPRLSPTIELPTASALLQRAGFDLPVTDMEPVTLTYIDMFALMRDLRGMGEANANAGRLRNFTRRAVFAEAAKLYRERHADAEGRIPATFEIIFLHGWKT